MNLNPDQNGAGAPDPVEATWRRPEQSGRPLGPKPQAAWGTRETLPASEARRQATSTGVPSAPARWGGSGSDQAKSGEPPASVSASEAGNTGWVDTHIHLLPGLDDGPATIEASVAMAEAAIADGTTHVVATSHANYQFQYSRARMLELGQQLGTLLDGRLRIGVGCELHLSYENVQAALENPRRYSLNGGRYLLCEFPEFFERTSMTGVLERFRGQDLIPVLAHPERNPVFQQTPDALREYLRLGCLSQVTASSLTGRFGKRAEQFSAEMLDRNWVHLIASDGHAVDRRPPHLSRAHAFLAERQGDEVAQALCSANPLALMFDRPLVYRPSLEARKRRGLFARLRG